MIHGVKKGLGLVLASAALCFATMGQAQEKTVLRFAGIIPPQSFMYTETIKPFLDRVVADSEGTLDIKYFLGGTLGRSPTEQLKLVVDGVADIAFVVPSYTPGVFKNYSVLEIPGVVESTKTASVALWEAFEQGMVERPEGVVMLGMIVTEPNVVHLKDEVSDLSGLKGKKIRAIGRPQVAFLEKFGASAVTGMGLGEVAQATSTGTVDGVLMDWSAATEVRLSEVAKNHIDIPMGSVAIMFPMNKSAWDKLPEPARKAFEKHMGMSFAIAAGEGLSQLVTTYRGKMAERGDVIVLPSAADLQQYQEAAADVEAEWVAGDAANETLLSGFKVLLEKAKGQQ